MADDSDQSAAGRLRKLGRALAGSAGAPYNPAPLATALPGPNPPFQLMGSPLLLPSDKQPVNNAANAAPHPAPWLAIQTPASASSPSPGSASPASVAPSFLQPPPTGFPSLLKSEIASPTHSSSAWNPETPRPSALPAMSQASPFAPSVPHVPHISSPNINLRAGKEERGASSIGTFVPTPSVPQSAASHTLGIGTQSTDVSLPSPSLHPPAGLAEFPPVPDSIPRDPVPIGARGEGWPYAPQGWPTADDKWGWRVGKRATPNNQWVDRYICLPKSLTTGRRPLEFASRKSLAEYLRQTFPRMNADSIFKAFDWKIPAPKHIEPSDKRGSGTKRDKPSPTAGDTSWQKPKRQCQANNPFCVLVKGKNRVSGSPESLPCHICCSEPGFCRECKCILCCKTFAPDADESSIVRCLNLPVPGRGICGHAAHLECALTSQLAGVIKKSGLDLEYLCRRCDRKTDLRGTVNRLVDIMSKGATLSKVEKNLQLALHIVQDPGDDTHTPAKTYAALIGDALRKVQVGADIAESYKELTKQLRGVQAGRSRATGRKAALDNTLYLSETSLDRWLPPSRAVGSLESPGTPSTLMSRGDSQSMPGVFTLPGGWNHTSPVKAEKTTPTGGSEADGVASSCGPRLQPVYHVDNALPSTSPELRANAEGKILDMTLSQSPSKFESAPLLSSLLDQGVCKSPTMSLEEHIRQCEAMASRVEGARQLNTIPSLARQLNTLPSLSSMKLSRVLRTVLGSRRELQPDSGDGATDTEVVEASRSPRTAQPTLSSSEAALESHAAGLEAEFEDQICQALEKLKSSQAAEYAWAEKALRAQKKVVVQQYQPLENVSWDFAKKENMRSSLPVTKDLSESRVQIDRAMTHLVAQFGKAKEGQKIFESMLAISNGFGQVSKDFLRELFNWPPQDTPDT